MTILTQKEIDDLIVRLGTGHPSRHIAEEAARMIRRLCDVAILAWSGEEFGEDRRMLGKIDRRVEPHPYYTIRMRQEDNLPERRNKHQCGRRYVLELEQTLEE